MRRCLITTFRPALERVEGRQLLSAGSVAPHPAKPSNAHTLASDIATSQAGPAQRAVTVNRTHLVPLATWLFALLTPRIRRLTS